MSEHPDTADWAQINVELPLPLEVAGALMELIGTAWPDAMVSTERRFGDFNGDRALSMRVNHRRRPKKVSKRKAAAIVGQNADQADEATAAGVGDADFLGFDDGWVSLAAPAELSLHLGSVCAHLLDANEDAVNYLEWEVREPARDDGTPGARYVLSAARSKGQTPHALHTRARDELADLRAKIHKEARALDAAEGVNPQGLAHVLRSMAGPEGD